MGSKQPTAHSARHEKAQLHSPSRWHMAAHVGQGAAGARPERAHHTLACGNRC
jgi:hypothetical protein